jgi:hypothetical protein
MTAWIDITEFSAKYGVSTSTLRRRIRSKSIPFRLERGKYLLEDDSGVLGNAPLFSRGHNPQLRTIRQSVVARSVTADTKIHTSKGVDENESNQALELLRAENKKLKNQLAELETYLRALEMELQNSR